MSDRSLKQHYAEPIKNPSGPILSTSTLYTTLFIKQLPNIMGSLAYLTFKNYISFADYLYKKI